jgi:DNA helicase HerA-like ATPase
MAYEQDLESFAIGIGPKAPVRLRLDRANRHGLIAGATGTGKTITLQTMAESFSRAGVPVFVTDVKGDLSGIAAPGAAKPKLMERFQRMGVSPLFDGAPTVPWDLLGAQGHPMRATVSEIGPLLFSRLLELNDVQSGVLNICFKLADDEGLLLLDLKDLRAVLTFVSEHAKELQARYGSVASASVGAIQRGLLTLESQGGEAFFGEPALDLADLMQVDAQGRGAINLFAADKLMDKPRLYAIFLLWLLAELFEQMPEAGDIDRPKLVFFFDEAHLLFNDAPQALVDEIERVVRLIRSKGVGIYFVTQNPLDVPETVLAQLGNRVQHALRAFTPRDQKAVRAAAETFRANPRLNTADAIMELGVGEALISVLDADGVPTIVERALICPPVSRIGPITPAERDELRAISPIGVKYDEVIDRESAFERLTGAGQAVSGGPAPEARTAPRGNPWGRAPEAAPAAHSPRYDPPSDRDHQGFRRPAGDAWGRGNPQSAPQSYDAPPAPRGGGLLDQLGGMLGGGQPTRGRGRRSDTIGETLVKSVTRTVGTEISRQFVRGVMGALLRR